MITCAHTQQEAIYLNTVFSFSIHGQIHHMNKDDTSWDKLHGHKLQNLLEVPKCLQFRPESRDRRPVAHYSHITCEQLKPASYPLSTFPLDSLDFCASHWSKTGIVLVSNINRNFKAHTRASSRDVAWKYHWPEMCGHRSPA